MQQLLPTKAKCLFIVILFSIVSFGQPVANDIEFKHLTVDDGLPSNVVYSIAQDNSGFIWIATSDGIARYDGYTVKVFRRGTKPSEIKDNYIYDVFIDSKGRIWIGTNSQGLFEFNPTTETFIAHEIQLANNDGTKLLRVRNIKESADGNLWLCTQLSGLIKYNPNTKESRHFFHDVVDKNSLVSDQVVDICFDNKGSTWVATRDSGITVINSDKSEYSHFNITSTKISNLSSDVVNAVFKSQDGTIYVGTGNSARYYDTASQSFVGLNNSETFSFYENKRGELFICSIDGLYISSNKRIDKKYEHNPSFPVGLSNSYIQNIFEDKSGVIWLGTRSGGVNFYYPKRKLFYSYANNPSDKFSLSHNIIRSFAIDSKENLWIATVHNGIDILNTKENNFYNINSGNFKGLEFKNTSIVKLLHDSKDNMWVGTWGQGSFVLKKGQLKFENIDPSIFQSTVILDLFEDSQGNIWTGTDYGLDIYNPVSGKIRQFKHIEGDSTTITPYGIQSNCIIEDINGDFWIGTYGGLNFFKRQYVSENIFEDEFKITNYTSESSENLNLSDNRIISMHYNPDAYKNKIFIGTYGGGFQVVDFEEEGAKIIKYYTTADGLSNNVIYAILSDNSGDIWISTNYGLTKYEPTRNFFRSYGPNDGLQDYQFFWGAALADKDGYLYFGGINGYNMFHPDSIKDDDYIPPIVFTDFRIFNNSISAGDTVNNRVILEKSINEEDLIKLTHKENMFSIEFSALHYAYPEDNSYEYMLEGFDEQFIRVKPNQRLATYTNLDAGTYTFRVRGSNFDGAWNPDEKTIQIKITPPFRKTLFFRILLLALTILLTGSLFFYRLSRIKQMGVILQQKVNEKTSELNESNKLLQVQTNELVKANNELRNRTSDLNDMNALLEERQQKVEEQSEELRAQAETLQVTNEELEHTNASKDKFFSILSHDLKNPFNYILGSSEILFRQFDKIKDEKKLAYAERIYKAAESTFNLLENLLTWSRTQSKKIIPDPIQLKVFDVIDQCLQILEGRISQKNIKISKNVDESLTVFVDNNMIHTIIQNVLTNAIKFSNPNGFIKIEAFPTNDSIEILIEDNGIGMSEEKIKNLFLIDKSVSSAGTNGETGTGLGLILCKEFILANHGSINIESELNKGTKVKIKLPIK